MGVPQPAQLSSAEASWEPSARARAMAAVNKAVRMMVSLNEAIFDAAETAGMLLIFG